MALASPLTVSGSDATVTRLVLDLSRYEDLKSTRRIRLLGLPLNETRQVDVVMRRIEPFAPDARVVVGSVNGDVPIGQPDIVVLTGRVVGRPDSHVLLGISPHGTNGYVRLGEEVFVISSGPYVENRATVVYDARTLDPEAIEWTAWQCQSDALLAPGARLWMQTGGQTPSGAPRDSNAPCRLADIALETDWEFTGDLFGGDPNAAGAYAALLVAAQSDIMLRDLNVRVQIVFLRLWTDPGDPWNGADTIDQLFQFQDYWNLHMGSVQRHWAHFLSGRPLGGGVAYLGALCYPDYDYALSADLSGYFPYPLQDHHPQNWDPFVFAHENGHVFGGPHTHDMNPPIDNCASGDCSVAPNGTIMSYCHTCDGGMVNIVLRYHNRMINEAILPFLDYDAPCDLTVPCCDGDLNGSGSVDLEDLTILLADFGCTGGGCPGDVDGDADTDLNDLALLLQNFGLPCQ